MSQVWPGSSPNPQPLVLIFLGVAAAHVAGDGNLRRLLGQIPPRGHSCGSGLLRPLSAFLDLNPWLQVSAASGVLERRSWGS